jgi:hypothetical protein
MSFYDKIYCKILQSSEDIYDAKHLLYRVYFEEQNWLHSPNNPSELRYETLQNGKKILEDKHDKLSTWFGAFYDGRLISCFRICSRDYANRLEMQLYQPSNDKLNDLLDINKNKHIVEANRVALDKSFRGKGLVHMKLIKSMYDYCIENKLSIVASHSTNFVSLAHLLDRITFKSVPEISFKYDQNDKYPVMVRFAYYHKGHLEEIKNKIDLSINSLLSADVKVKSEEKKKLSGVKLRPKF